MSARKPTPPATSAEPAGPLAHDAIRGQLDRILASPEFHATSRMHDFLRFIIEETLAGRSDQLKGFTIATQVFGRNQDFDAAQDPIVRIQAGRLRRALERYYLVAGTQDAIIIDIPKGRYVPVFVNRPPAATTPAEDMAADAVSSSHLGPSIAVMPLEDLSPDTKQGFFAVGLAEELFTELNRFQDIVVVPCQRVENVLDSPQAMMQICRDLGARFLLDGSVRRDATTAKVSARLVDTTTGRQVWARAFKHSLAAVDLIETQEEIAADVVTAVGSEYGIIARRLAAESRKKRPAELSTYEAMLRYYSYQIAPSPAASAACFEALGAAVVREPDYGPAWSALATLHCQMYIFDVPGLDDPLATGLAHAQRGVYLEPGRQLSRLILAYASLLADDLDTYSSEAETALSLNPNNPYAAGATGYMNVLAGEFERGCRLIDRAKAISPVRPHWFRHGYYFAQFGRGDYQGAFDALTPVGVADPWEPALYSAALGKLGRAEEASSTNAALRAWKPDFGRRAHELIQRAIKSPELVDDFMDGLRSAGALQDEPRASTAGRGTDGS